MAEDAAIRQVSELQSKGPDILAEVKRHPVELRRYNQTVAYLVSPEAHRHALELEDAAERALWQLAIQRGLKDLAEGRVTVWDEASAARLRAQFPGR